MIGMKNDLKNKPMIGTFVKTVSPEIVEMIALAGFDFIIIDAEHSPFSFENIRNLTAIAQGAGLKVVVRPAEISRSQIQYSLDIGSDGIQIPQIYNEKDVDEIMSYCKYSPLGTRGITLSHRAANYGYTNKEEYIENANNNLLINIHIETRESLENIEEIAKKDGVDLLFLGPADLSHSLNTKNDLLSGKLNDSFNIIKEAADKYGKMVGTLINSEEQLEFCIEKNVNFIVWTTDLSMLKKEMDSVVKMVNQKLK